MYLRTTQPSAKVNNSLRMTKEQWEILIANRGQFDGHSYKHPNIVDNAMSKTTYFYAEFLNRSFVYLVTETVCEYPYPYFSEKTWKAINTGRPFLLLGAQYSLKQLRNWGFKTFSNWWSEKYDELPTAVDRVDAIAQVIKDLSSRTMNELTVLEQEMLPVLEYNQQHLVEFARQDLERVRKVLQSHK